MISKNDQNLYIYAEWEFDTRGPYGIIKIDNMSIPFNWPLQLTLHCDVCCKLLFEQVWVSMFVHYSQLVMLHSLSAQTHKVV